jgi:hypothetical protein
MNDDLPTVYYPLSVLDSLMLDPSRTMNAIERAVAEERAAVVAWLRSQAETTNYRPRGCPLADAIERGEHRREDAP